MYEVNRSVAILRPKAPFFNWLIALPGAVDPSITLENLQQNGTALLVPVADDPDELHHFIQQHSVSLFQAELADWCEDQALWPSPLKHELFLQWFDIGLHPIVTDVVDEALEREPFVPFDLELD